MKFAKAAGRQFEPGPCLSRRPVPGREIKPGIQTDLIPRDQSDVYLQDRRCRARASPVIQPDCHLQAWLEILRRRSGRERSTVRVDPQSGMLTFCCQPRGATLCKWARAMHETGTVRFEAPKTARDLLAGSYPRLL